RRPRPARKARKKKRKPKTKKRPRTPTKSDLRGSFQPPQQGAFVEVVHGGIVHARSGPGIIERRIDRCEPGPVGIRTEQAIWGDGRRAKREPPHHRVIHVEVRVRVWR